MPAILLDGQGRVAVANDPARDRFGAWMLERSYVSVLRQPALVEPVEDAYFLNRAGTARFTHSEGEVETVFEVSITPVPDLADGGRRPVLLVFHDISDARAGAAMRRDFVANVSHELRTPLTAALGFVETVAGPARDDPAARQRFLERAATELRRMDRLVSDLLSLSRLEGQSRQMPHATVDLAHLCREAVALLSGVAEGASVEVETQAHGPAEVPGDRDQLLQVVTNLLENAIKYGARPGKVRLALSHLAREPALRRPAWRLTVANEGPGVAPEHIPRLTERFYRVDTGRSRAEGGTGLGLAIVKHIVNRHRGRLRIESGLGEGMQVTVTLPAHD